MYEGAAAMSHKPNPWMTEPAMAMDLRRPMRSDSLPATRLQTTVIAACTRVERKIKRGTCEGSNPSASISRKGW